MSTYKRSIQIGMSKSYLSVYRHSRGLPKHCSELVVFEAYNKEKDEQEKVIGKLQDMYYFLLGEKKVLDFSKNLVRIKLYKSTHCLHRISPDWFRTTNALRHRSAMEKWKQILAEFEEYKKLLHGGGKSEIKEQ